ncbi:MAG: tetratricopeptide repeat protein [Bacteroidetes bacterium]|nr:tetratricopeptide repeat protein [Bacteroidota bacterium]
MLRRTYHNLTSHFNVYWNGMDNMRQGIKEYKASLKDNYSLVLPVYNYGDKASGVKMAQYADIAIKKASKAINKHSMPFNRKEYVRWIDDCYMLIGKAHFYKQDYPMARRTFEFVIKTYNYNDIKYEAMLWVARSNNQIGDFNKAESMLDMLLGKMNKGEASQKFETEINLEYAQLQILKKNYESAIPYLTRALELNPPSKMRTRCKFILGQIYQLNGEIDEASRYFLEVLKKASDYEMEFNAKINIAECYNAKSGDREFIIKKLTKMLKDDKNTEYQDQIYFALANIEMKDADTAAAIDLYKKSVSASVKNNYQKAISSLSLADIYFESRKYLQAQLYYDSTLQFLPKDYANYKELSQRTSTLTDLVKNLQVIYRQDSLQALAGMSEDKRNKVIDKIIADLAEAERKKQMDEQKRVANQSLFGQNTGQEQQAIGSKEGRWYFYNPTIMASGFSTFRRKWGQRKLEDNWFLTDKTVAAFSEEQPAGEDTTGASTDTTKNGKKGLAKSKNPKERAYYLPDIPVTKEKIQASNDMIIEAYYQAGFIFVEGLGDYSNSIETFEKLLDRFPDNKYKMQSAYELCMLYKHLQNDPKSDFFKNQILTLYPQSDYAKLLVNPDYYKEINSRQSEAARLYNDTYKAFTNQQYYMVINNGDIARTRFKTDSVLMPKFDYLRALEIGKIEIVDSLVVAMNKIITDYPKSKVRPLAENVLAFLGPKKNSSGVTIGKDSSSVAPVATELYKFDPNAVHFYILIVNDNLVDVEALKVKLSDYNSKYHDLENLMVNSLVLDEGRQMITVNNFDNSSKALTYILGIRDSKYIFTKLQNAGEYYDFVISVENYPVFYRNKDITQYLRFFEKYYPIQK